MGEMPRYIAAMDAADAVTCLTDAVVHQNDRAGQLAHEALVVLGEELCGEDFGLGLCTCEDDERFPPDTGVVGLKALAWAETRLRMGDVEGALRGLAEAVPDAARLADALAAHFNLPMLP